MRTAPLVLAVAAVSVACSAATTAVAPTTAPTTTVPVDSTAAPSTSTTTTAPAATSPPTTSVGPVALVVWSGDGVDDPLLDAVRARPEVEEVAVVRSGTVHLVATADVDGRPVDAPAEGYVIPVDVVAVTRSTIASFVDGETAAALAALGEDEVVIGATSARVRRLGVGGTLTVEGGATFRVAGVLPDRVMGSGEVLAVTDGVFGTTPPDPRFAYVSVTEDPDGDVAADLEDDLGAALDDVIEVRVRYVVSTGRDRSTQPQAVVKERFGEFAYRPVGGGRFEIDPAWTDAHLVEVDLPLVGPVRCHRELIPILRRVLGGLVADGLADVVDPAAFQGCWNPRYVAGTTRLSRHAFGAAVDLNFGNPTDDAPGSPVHPELLDRMTAEGMTSGHDWSNPDPGHFEWFSDPITDG